MRGLLFGRALSGAMLLVAAGGGTAKAESLSLAQAIAQAPPGATLIVSSKIHHGNLKITKPLKLVGEPGAILDGDGKGDVVRIAASDVTVRDLTIRNSGTSLTHMDAGIYIEKKARDVVIQGNNLEHVLFGIYLDGSRGTQVLYNRIRGMTELRVPDRGDGIHLWDDTGVVVQGNDVSGTRDGIYIYISPHNRIIGNRIHSVRYGVHYMFSNHDLLANNLSLHNTAGYALMESDHLQVDGNQARGDQLYGILLNYITYSDFAGNSVSGVKGQKGLDGALIPGAEGKGFFVYNSEYDKFHDNEIADCAIGIHVTAGSKHDVYYANSFLDNRVQVKYVQNVTEEWSWHGAGNYWSDYLGWDLNGDGIGDVPYRPNSGVDILLWKYPMASLLMSSPAILAMRYVERAFPVFTAPSVEDSHPLMKPQARIAVRGVKGSDAERR